MSKFGWSYPAGCSGPPDVDYTPSPESDEVCGLMNEAGVDIEIIDKVCEIIDRLADRQCEKCTREQIEAENRVELEMSHQFLGIKRHPDGVLELPE